jgi:transposase InsO family protein
MSRAGNPYDHAPMAHFYNTMKSELIYQYSFDTDEDLNEAVSEYIFDWYNYRRPHSYNNGLTPFEARHI